MLFKNQDIYWVKAYLCIIEQFGRENYLLRQLGE